MQATRPINKSPPALAARAMIIVSDNNGVAGGVLTTIESLAESDIVGVIMLLLVVVVVVLPESEIVAVVESDSDIVPVAADIIDGDTIVGSGSPPVDTMRLARSRCIRHPPKSLHARLPLSVVTENVSSDGHTSR